MTEHELAEAEARYQRAFAHSEAERANRNAAIQAAIDDHWTHERIAKAIGRTRARVGQIAAQKPAAAPQPYQDIFFVE